MAEPLKERLLSRAQELERLRSNWDDDYRAIGQHFFSTTPRFGRKDYNKRGRINGTVINSKPVIDLGVLTSGLVAGMTSPSRQWFGLTTADADLADQPNVSRYLYDCRKRIEWAFSRSNLYAVLADHVYPGIGSYATAVAFLEEDFKTGIRLFNSPVGDWSLDVGPTGVVDTIVRELPFTIRNLVKWFGYDNVSPQAQALYDKGNYQNVVWVRHFVAPNEDYEPGRADVSGKAFGSWWWEESSPKLDGFLRVSGYEEFPALCPRWSTAADPVYGVGPGFAAKGDAAALQHLEKKNARLFDKVTDPPMQGPEELMNRRVSLLPGDMTYTPRGSTAKLEPAQIVPPSALEASLKHIERHEKRIDEAFYTDLFRALLDDNRKQRATATEVEAVRQEVMLQLGPLLERMNLDLLEPLIARTFATLGRQGALPPPPKELQGAELKIEFLSVLHQVQKLTALSGVRTLVQSVGDLNAIGRPDALDMLNVDEIIIRIADMAGVEPELVMSTDEAKAIRSARAARLKSDQDGQAALAATQGAKNLAGVDPQSLGEIARSLSPAASAQGGIQAGLAS